MKVEIKVPPAGESVTEATVATILKPTGSYVSKDEEIIELETDKVNQIVHAPEAGVLTLNVALEEKVSIDQVIGTIDTEGKSTGAPLPQKKEEAAPPPPVAKPSKIEEGVRRSPESYIASLEASQPPIAPVAPLPTKPVATGEQTRKRMSGLRRTIAKRLVEVKNQTAMLTTFNEVDMSAIMHIRSQEKESFLSKHGIKLGFMSFFVKAVTSALIEFPDVNAFIDGDEIVYNHTYHIGISVSTEKGLLVPVVRNCDELTFAEIEKAIQDYAKKARAGLISIDDLQGGSFTITNGGTFGSMLSTPILNPPQSGILGMHNIVKRAVVVDDQIVIRPMMYLALSYDHRIIDGKEAVSFLVRVKENLEKPERLLLL